MEKQELAIAIISVALFVIVVISFLKFYISEREGFSKENIECNILPFIPFLCSEEDLQKLQLAQSPTIHTDNCKKLLENIMDLYQNCGKNSNNQKCRCEFDYSFIKDTSTSLNIVDLGNNLIRFQACATSKVEALLGLLYIDQINLPSTLTPPNGNQHKLLPLKVYTTNKMSFDYKLIPAGGTNSNLLRTFSKILGGKDTNVFYLDAGEYIIYWLEPPEYPAQQGKLGILKDGNKKGIYIPYSGIITKKGQDYSEGENTLRYPNLRNEEVPLC